MKIRLLGVFLLLFQSVLASAEGMTRSQAYEVIGGCFKALLEEFVTESAEKPVHFVNFSPKFRIGFFGDVEILMIEINEESTWSSGLIPFRFRSEGTLTKMWVPRGWGTIKTRYVTGPLPHVSLIKIKSTAANSGQDLVRARLITHDLTFRKELYFDSFLYDYFLNAEKYETCLRAGLESILISSKF